MSMLTIIHLLVRHIYYTLFPGKFIVSILPLEPGDGDAPKALACS
jgi:hypothetical protein